MTTPTPHPKAVEAAETKLLRDIKSVFPALKQIVFLANINEECRKMLVAIANTLNKAVKDYETGQHHRFQWKDRKITKT